MQLLSKGRRHRFSLFYFTIFFLSWLFYLYYFFKKTLANKTYFLVISFGSAGIAQLVEFQPSKLAARVRVSLPAPNCREIIIVSRILLFTKKASSVHLLFLFCKIFINTIVYSPFYKKYAITIFIFINSGGSSKNN